MNEIRRALKIEQQKMFPGVKIETAGKGYVYHGPSQSLPEICLSLRQSLNGAAEPWSEEDVIRAYNLLKGTFDHWEPSIFDSDIVMDEAIKNLIGATLRYVERHYKKLGKSNLLLTTS